MDIALEMMAPRSTGSCTGPPQASPLWRRYLCNVAGQPIEHRHSEPREKSPGHTKHGYSSPCTRNPTKYNTEAPAYVQAGPSHKLAAILAGRVDQLWTMKKNASCLGTPKYA